MKRVLGFFIVVLMSSQLLVAGEKYAPKFSGYMFGDMYWLAQNHNTSLEGSEGFWFRRIYFTFDQQIQEKLFVRLRLEMASAGDLSTSSKSLTPFVKDAYLRWKYTNGHELFFGISEPPTIKVYEKIWGKRYLEKTPLDLQKMAHSRDFGIAMRGKVPGSDHLKYNVMFANGSGNKSEVNSGKKFMAGITYQPAKNWIFEVYGDFNDNNGTDDFSTIKVFTGYKSEDLRGGISYASQTHQTAGNKDYNLDLLSAFAIYKYAEKWSIIGRIDRNFDANPSGHKISYIPFDNTAASTFILAGLEYSPVKSLRLTPNIELVNYDENSAGTTPEMDVIPRITFYYEFK